MGIATFAGIFAANNRQAYCGSKNNINALRRGNKHTGVLWLSALFLCIFFIIHLKNKNIMSKCRIIERTNVDGRKEFVIQQKHFLFRWWWVDAWINSSAGAECTDSFSTLEEAKKNLCYFDNSKCIERIVS